MYQGAALGAVFGIAEYLNTPPPISSAGDGEGLVVGGINSEGGPGQGTNRKNLRNYAEKLGLDPDLNVYEPFGKGICRGVGDVAAEGLGWNHRSSLLGKYISSLGPLDSVYAHSGGGTLVLKLGVEAKITHIMGSPIFGKIGHHTGQIHLYHGMLDPLSWSQIWTQGNTIRLGIQIGGGVYHHLLSVNHGGYFIRVP